MAHRFDISSSPFNASPEVLARVREAARRHMGPHYLPGMFAAHGPSQLTISLSGERAATASIHLAAFVKALGPLLDMPVEIRLRTHASKDPNETYTDSYFHAVPYEAMYEPFKERCIAGLALYQMYLHSDNKPSEAMKAATAALTALVDRFEQAHRCESTDQTREQPISLNACPSPTP